MNFLEFLRMVNVKYCRIVLYLRITGGVDWILKVH